MQDSGLRPDKQQGGLAVGVVGVGYFGRLHAEKLARLPGARLLAVADRDPARAEAVAEEFGVAAVTEHRKLLDRLDAVSIAVPTAEHFAVARDFLEAGVHVLLEKPIAATLAEADALQRLAGERSLVLQIGHLVRFTGMYEVLKKSLTRPLYIESLRITPYRDRGADVNVILDLMIHDLDVVLSLVDAPLVSIDAVGAPVFSASEDIANARLKFANGCIANIVASRISLKTERKMRIFQPDSYITVDFDKASVTTIQKTGPRGPQDLKIANEHFPELDALEREIADFLDCVAEGRPARVGPAAGREALSAAIEVTESLRRHLAVLQGAEPAR